ncbi:MAG: hypothetical protein ACREQ5_11015 [Candidatus Dormibacteria bacterium]
MPTTPLSITTPLPGVTLRRLTRKDADLVYDLERKNIAADGRISSTELYKRRIDSGKYLAFGLFLGADSCGYSLIEIKEVDGVKTGNWLKFVSDQKGRSLGSVMAIAIGEELKKIGVKTIIGRCEPALLKYYQRLGAKAQGVLPNFFGPGKEAIALKVEF